MTTAPLDSLAAFSASRETSTPLYMQISQHIQALIRSGHYPVGSLLPRELEMAEAMNVSRQTVRQAVEQLKHLGLISAKKGVGTRVEGRQPSAGYQFALQSLTDIFQYASATEFVVRDERVVAARGKLAVELGCRSGRQFLHLKGIRRVVGDNRPFCFSEVWIDAQYSAPVKGVAVHGRAMFSQIEETFGETIVEVMQDIRAETLSGERARELDAPEAGAALEVVRRYFGTGRRLVQMSRSIHPADRFSYSMAFRRN